MRICHTEGFNVQIVIPKPFHRFTIFSFSFFFFFRIFRVESVKKFPSSFSEVFLSGGKVLFSRFILLSGRGINLFAPLSFSTRTAEDRGSDGGRTWGRKAFKKLPHIEYLETARITRYRSENTRAIMKYLISSKLEKSSFIFKL